MEKTVVTHSSLATLRECPQKYYLKYVMGIRPMEKSESIRVGSLVHHALDLMAKNPEKPIEEIIVETKAFAGKEQERRIEAMRDATEAEKKDQIAQFITESILIQEILTVYHWRWSLHEVKVVESEKAFESQIYNPDTNKPSRTFQIAGKIDRIVTMPSGDFALMETKTTRESLDVNSDYWKRLPLDVQISLYYLASQSLGYPVTSILYDVIRVPTIKPRELTQTETAVLIDMGTYSTRLEQGKEPVLIAEEVQVAVVGDLNPKAGVFPERIVVNGHEAEIIPGKAGVAIRETPELYGMRLRKLLVEKHEEFFARREIPRTDTDLSLARMELWVQTQILNERMKRGCWERNDRACRSFFGYCPFWKICTSRLQEGEMPEGFEVVDNLHPELKETEE